MLKTIKMLNFGVLRLFFTQVKKIKKSIFARIKACNV